MPRLAAFPKGFVAALLDGRMSVFEWIELAGSLGVDGVELYPRFLEAFDSRYLSRVRGAAEARGARAADDVPLAGLHPARCRRAAARGRAHARDAEGDRRARRRPL